MGKRVKVIIGAIYEVIATEECNVNVDDENGMLIVTVEPGTPQTFVAPSEWVWVTDVEAEVTRGF